MTKSTSKKTKEIWGKRIQNQEQKGFLKKRRLPENNLQLSALYYQVKKLSLKSQRVLKKCDNPKNLNPLLVKFLEERCYTIYQKQALVFAQSLEHNCRIAPLREAKASQASQQLLTM